MIEAMMLCQRKGRNDPKDLEGVLPVLDRRPYDGGDGGVVLRAGFRAEASADLEFGLGRPQGLLAVVVRGRDGGVREEGEDVVPVFGDAFLELVQFGAVPVLFRVDRRPRQQFVQPRLHILPRPCPDFPPVPPVHGVPQEVKHVQAPGVIREGLRRVGEVPQQVDYADLMVFHPDVPHEVGRPAVRHPDGPAPLLRREAPVHHVAAPAFVKGQIGRGLVLEGPEPAVLSAHVDPRLIRSGNLSGRDLPADHLVRLLRDSLHGVQHVGHGPLADVKPEDGLEQVREPLERDVLIGAEVRGERHDVGTEGYRGVHVLGEPALAAVAAGALHPHLEMPRHRRHDRKRDVHHLPRGGDCRRFHVQRFAAHEMHNEDTLAFIQQNVERLSDPHLFMYLDPPYYKNGSSLYLNAYNHQDHENLRNLMAGLRDLKWMISYDDVEEIHQLEGFRTAQHELSYFLQQKRKTNEFFVFSDTITL